MGLAVDSAALQNNATYSSQVKPASV